MPAAGFVPTPDDVRGWVGAGPFGRAQPYVGTDALFDVRREGGTLKASCQGSLPEPYAVQVTLTDGQITTGSCSCPVGDGGRCKHVAALLLTWADDPEAVPETKPVAQALARRSPAELIALVQRMIARHPDLEMLVVRPAGAPPDAAQVERQLRRLFSGDLYSWESAYRIGRALEQFVRQAEALAEHADAAGAFAICQPLLDQVLEHYLEFQDEEGHLAAVVSETVRVLGRCLEQAILPDLHRAIAELLYDVLRADTEIGGVGLGDDARPLLLAHATPDERAALCDRIRADLGRIPPDKWSAGWRQQQLGALLLTLYPGELDDAAYLDLCRASGRTGDLVERLLALGRLDDARAAAESAPEYELLTLLPLFLEHGHGETADALVLARLTDRRLVEWLKGRARDRGDAALAVRLAERLFWDAPTPARYAEVIALSRSLGRHGAARAAIHQRLREEKRLDALAYAHLHDGDLGKALKLLRRAEGAWYGRKPAVRLAVAAACAAERPDDAVELYLEAATDLVAQRSRTAYAEAARVLLDVRAVEQARGDLAAWRRMLAAFRDEFRRLPALQDEMNQAGLEREDRKPLPPKR